MASKIIASTDPSYIKPVIDKELLDYLPLLSEKEDAQLERLLIEEGCRERILVWSGPNVLVDGHRRFRLCERHGIAYRIEYRDFANKEAAKKWMARNQLHGKRNLSDRDRDYYIGELYRAEKQTVGGQTPATASGNPTAKSVGKRYKVSASKVMKDAAFAAAVNAHEAENPGSRKRILAGEMGSKDKVIATAPILCERCIEKGKTKDCKECEEARAKHKKKHSRNRNPPANLLDVLKPKKGAEDAPPVDPLDELAALTTQLATKFTNVVRFGKGEVTQGADRLRDYLTWCGLLDYPTVGANPKFIPLAGVKALVDLAGSKGPKAPQDVVMEMYQKACGAVPWVPPAVKYRRDKRSKT